MALRIEVLRVLDTMRALHDFTKDHTLNVEQGGFCGRRGFLVVTDYDDASVAVGAPYLVADLEKGAVTFRAVFKEHRGARPQQLRHALHRTTISAHGFMFSGQRALGRGKENDYRSSDYPLTFSRMETTFQIRVRV